MSQASLSAVNANSGTLLKSDSSWSTARSAASSDTAVTGNSETVQAAKPGANYDLRRLLVEFNTTGIPFVIKVESVIFTASGTPQNNQESTFSVLTGSTAASGALATAMYNDLVLNSPTELAARVSLDSNPVFTLNAAGRAYVETEIAKENNFIKFFVRNSRDVDNATPTGNNNLQNSTGGNSSIVINYSVSGGNVMMFSGGVVIG